MAVARSRSGRCCFRPTPSSGLTCSGTAPADATPARVPDTVIDGLRASERDGLIDLPRPPRFARGDKVRITRGPFREHLALYDGQTANQRVAVLLRPLGGERRIELREDAVEQVP